MQRLAALRFGQLGFTLLELIVSLAISGFLVASIAAVLVFYRNAGHNQRIHDNLWQNLRSALDTLGRDVRMAGYGVAVPDEELPLWFDWVEPLTNVCTVTRGGTSDTVTVIHAREEPVAELAFDSEPGDTTLVLRPGEVGAFALESRKVIYIGKLETARIVGRLDDRLFVSTDPIRPDRGLEHYYPAGTPIELVKVVTYSTAVLEDAQDTLFCLLRDDGEQGAGSVMQRATAVCVERLDVSLDGNVVNVSLNGKSTRPAHRFAPSGGDGYMRMTVGSSFVIRNR